MEPRARRIVNQSKWAPGVCADGPIKGYARLHWILVAAQSFKLRRAFQTLNGGKVHGISHAADPDPKHLAEGRSRRTWCREEPQPEEPYALIGHVRFCEGRQLRAGVYSISARTCSGTDPIGFVVHNSSTGWESRCAPQRQQSSFYTKLSRTG